MRLASQLKKMRRHQRYDAEQIVRDTGKMAGDEALFGPVFNVKLFDYRLGFDKIEAITHALARKHRVVLMSQCGSFGGHLLPGRV